MKPIALALLILTIYYQSLFGQNLLSDSVLNKSTVMKIRFANTVNCDEIAQWIKSDISNKTIFLFLQGGEVPIVYKNDTAAQKHYGIYYYDFGCIGFADYKCVIKYDDYIFNYLTKTYGKKWMKEIRKDVIGYKDWSLKNNKPGSNRDL